MKFKYNDDVIVVTEFFNKVPGTVVGYRRTDRPHPDQDRNIVEYEVAMPRPYVEATTVWFSETVLQEPIYTKDRRT